MHVHRYSCTYKIQVCAIFRLSTGLSLASLKRTLCAWLAMVAVLLTPAKQATDAHANAELGTEFSILSRSAMRYQMLAEPVILKP